MTAAPGHNKVVAFEDFTDPELRTLMRDIFRHELPSHTADFPTGVEYRKYWEIAMSVRALRQFGALRPDARILGVGAGTETTLFWLTHYVREVVATDLYNDPGVWGQFAPGFMLKEPEKVAPYPYPHERLTVMHMNGTKLEFPDESFDGIFSSGSIEHFGSFKQIAQSAREMGRVLKPGGVLTLSTEYKVKGPLFRSGFDGLRFFSRYSLLRHIVRPSGLKLVDALDTRITPPTMASAWPLMEYGKDRDRQILPDAAYPMVNEVVWSHYPHLMLILEPYWFTSMHLTLVKPKVQA